MQTSYLPVEWVFREVIEEAITEGKEGKVFYFEQAPRISEALGRVLKMEDIENEGVFIFMDSGDRIRIDLIITLFGKPGAAYDSYDAYANACLDCMGGYDKEDLERM